MSTRSLPPERLDAPAARRVHKAGIGRMTIVRAERGHHLPRAGILQRLAATLGVAVDGLLTGQTNGTERRATGEGRG